MTIASLRSLIASTKSLIDQFADISEKQRTQDATLSDLNTYVGLLGRVSLVETQAETLSALVETVEALGLRQGSLVLAVGVDGALYQYHGEGTLICQPFLLPPEPGNIVIAQRGEHPAVIWAVDSVTESVIHWRALV